MTSPATGAASQSGPHAAPWNWPWSMAQEQVRLWVDMDAVLLLERSAPQFWQAFQERSLRALVAHARQSSAWWRDWLGAMPSTPSLEELARVPVLRRTDFRAAIESSGALPGPPAHGSTEAVRTSGSSGVPARFHRSQWQHRMNDAHYKADHVRQGRDMRLPAAAILTRFAAHPHAAHHYEPPHPAQGTGPVYMRCTAPYSMREHALWLAAVDPAWLNTLATVLTGMLDAFEDGIAPPRNVRQVMQIGETVTPALRERARRVLGARISDRYTCEEVGPIAFQCPQDDERYHVCVANAIVEVVDASGRACAEGELGSVLVTGLHQWASPAIRYELGDIAALHAQCTCGERIPSLSNLLGRKRFLVRMPSGERVYVHVTAAHWLDVAPIREHRLTQTTELDVHAELVLDRPLTAAEHEAAVHMLRGKLHPDFRFHVEQVQAIAWGPSPKRQDVVCLV